MPEPFYNSLPLVGLAEIAEATGRSNTGVSNWRTRNEDFPRPVAELKCGPIFWWPTVEVWLRRHDLL